MDVARYRPSNAPLPHAKGLHRHNYTDLPLLDIVFDVFRNPRELEESEYGFCSGAQIRITDMLIGKDVREPERSRPDGVTAPAG